MDNLHLVTGFLGREHITAADQGAFNAALIGTGQFVLEKGKVFEAQVISNNLIRVLDGELMMQGRFVRLAPNEYAELAIENGEKDLKRNDLIAVRYTKDTLSGIESVNLVVIKGEAVEGEPVDPAITEGDITNGEAILHEFPLWRIPIDGLNVGEPVALYGLPFIDSMQTLHTIREDMNAQIAEQNAQYEAAFEEQNSAFQKAVDGFGGYTKTETLSPSTKTALGLSEDAVPDDALMKLLGKTFKVGDTLTTLRTELDDKWLLANGDAISLADYPGLDSENIKTLTTAQGTLNATGGRLCRVDEQNILICNKGEIYTFTEPSQGFALVATLPVGTSTFYPHKLIHKGGRWVCVGQLGNLAYSFASENLEGTWYSVQMSSEEYGCVWDVDYYDGTWVAVGQKNSSSIGCVWYTTNPLVWNLKEISGAKTYTIICHNGTWICGGADTNYNKGYAKVWTASDPSGEWKSTYNNSVTVISLGTTATNMRVAEHNGVVYLIYGTSASNANTIIALESNNNGASWTLHSITSKLSYEGIIDVYFDNNKWYIVTSDASTKSYVYTTEDIAVNQWQTIYSSGISGQNFVGYIPLGANDWIAVHGNAYKTRKLVKLPTITIDNAYVYIKVKE